MSLKTLNPKREAGTCSERVATLKDGLRLREFFIDNLLVRIHFIIVMIRWSGLLPWEFEFPFPGSLTSTFLKLKPSNPNAKAGKCSERVATLKDGLTSRAIPLPNLD